MTSEGILLPGWTCPHCHCFHGTTEGSGEPAESDCRFCSGRGWIGVRADAFKPAGRQDCQKCNGSGKSYSKVPRKTCRSCGAERPSTSNVIGVPNGFELVAGLALVDGELTLMKKKLEAYEASERAYKAEIVALEQRITELQSRGTELVLERQTMREGIAQHLESYFRPEVGRDFADKVRSCAWDKPIPNRTCGKIWRQGPTSLPEVRTSGVCGREAGHDGDCY
jgi:hypothetical protein